MAPDVKIKFFADDKAAAAAFTAMEKKVDNLENKLKFSKGKKSVADD